jgi:hypothetical protein
MLKHVPAVFARDKNDGQGVSKGFRQTGKVVGDKRYLRLSEDLEVLTQTPLTGLHSISLA